MRALNRLGRGQRSWDLLGGDPSSDQYGLPIGGDLRGGVRGRTAVAERFPMPAGRRNAGGPMRTHLEQAPAIGTLAATPFSSPLAIHRFRDRAAGMPMFWCWLMWCAATRVLGESSWSRQPTSFGTCGVDSADGAGKTRAPDTAGRAAHPRAAALSSEELVEGRRDGGGHPVHSDE
jgi:hypothetical protein